MTWLLKDESIFNLEVECLRIHFGCVHPILGFMNDSFDFDCLGCDGGMRRVTNFRERDGWFQSDHCQAESRCFSIIRNASGKIVRGNSFIIGRKNTYEVAELSPLGQRSVKMCDGKRLTASSIGNWFVCKRIGGDEKSMTIISTVVFEEAVKQMDIHGIL
mmetsp:Transcript_3600/g.5225  ORF Transcript_3600/g.5225 Transcript_3600/m.5225 type:complete len:160 (-) Transcript_3600:761-1240(-)